jgi:hypothetical protein
VRICGDDLVGVTNSLGRERYEENARASGAKFSGPSKHIFCAGGGVFTEEIFFTEESNSGETRLRRWSEAFPTRGIIGTMRCDKTGRESPYGLSVGPAVEGMMKHRDRKARRAILYLIGVVHPELKGFLRRFGLLRLLHIPRQLGGLGLPSETLWNFRVEKSTKEVDRAALVLATSCGWEDDLSILSRPYDTAPHTTLPLRQIASQEAEFVIGGRYRVIKKGSQVPIGWFAYPGTVTDLIDKVTGNVARDLFFLAPLEPAPKSKPAFNARSSWTARTLSRSLDRARRALISSRGGWLFAEKKKRNEQVTIEREGGGGVMTPSQESDLSSESRPAGTGPPTPPPGETEDGRESGTSSPTGRTNVTLTGAAGLPGARTPPPARTDTGFEGRGREVAMATPPRWTPARTIDPRSLGEEEQVNLLALSVGMGFTMSEIARLPEWERTLLLENVMEKWSLGSPMPPMKSAENRLVARLQGSVPPSGISGRPANEADESRGENHGVVSFSWADLLDRITKIEESRLACLIPDQHALEGILGQRFQETEWWMKLVQKEKLRAKQENRPPPAATPLREMAGRSIRDLVSKSLHWPVNG